MLGMRAALCEQGREPVPVAHHRRVGELAAQGLDLDAITDGLTRTRPYPVGRLSTYATYAAIARASVVTCIEDGESDRHRG